MIKGENLLVSRTQKIFSIIAEDIKFISFERISHIDFFWKNNPRAAEECARERPWI